MAIVRDEKWQETWGIRREHWMAIRKSTKERNSATGHLKIVEPPKSVSNPEPSAGNGEVTMGNTCWNYIGHDKIYITRYNIKIY